MQKFVDQKLNFIQLLFLVLYLVMGGKFKTACRGFSPLCDVKVFARGDGHAWLQKGLHVE